MPPELPTSSSAVLPVSLLVSSARLLIERHLGLVWVSGEISNFMRAASGHCYFNLKDAHAQVRCVMFRQKAQHVGFPLRDGLAVEVRATPSIYEARGEFQLNADTIRLAGVGALYEQFERLKAKLEAAGWFAAERKRPLPAWPRTVGIVTSPRAAALRDILTTLSRRWPRLRVILYPTAVQGTGAAAEIAAAIAMANARAEVDVLIVARGGGSIEDLWSFNEEAVARALFDSRLPTVSGVGHETDFTISDFVADLRAPTPTAAATLVVQDRDAVAAKVAALAARLARAVRQGQEARAQRLDQAARRLIHPAQRIAAQRERTVALARRLQRAWQVDALARSAQTRGLQARLWRELRAPMPARGRLQVLLAAWSRLARLRVARARERVAALDQNLTHLNPQGVLDRGYALVRDTEGRVVQRAAQLARDDPVSITFAHDSADAVIARVNPETP